MIYIASPYSSPILGIQEQRYAAVCKFVDRMISKGFVAFSTIVYCHPIAQRIGQSTDHKTWLHFNMAVLRKCEAMYVLQLPGWQESKGVALEIKVCKMLNIPVVYYDADFRLASDEYKAALVEQF